MHVKIPTNLVVVDQSGFDAYLDKLFYIGSFPRSGSHWTRRMMAEIVVMRGEFKDASFGRNLQMVSGFLPPAVNAKKIKNWNTPFFTATHSFTPEVVGHMPIYLRRNFDEVLVSTRKAMDELNNCWWGGSDEEIYVKWSKHVAKGCAIADVVIDYEMTKTDPATTVRTIAKVAGMTLTDEEVNRAVNAGKRENMLAEQTKLEKRSWNIINEESMNESY